MGHLHLPFQIDNFRFLFVDEGSIARGGKLWLHILGFLSLVLRGLLEGLLLEMRELDGFAFEQFLNGQNLEDIEVIAVVELVFGHRGGL